MKPDKVTALAAILRSKLTGSSLDDFIGGAKDYTEACDFLCDWLAEQIADQVDVTATVGSALSAGIDEP